MEERVGKKVNIDRTDEALAVGTDVVGVGCPFCHIMLDDGVKERGADDKMKVRDLAQILEEIVQPASDKLLAVVSGSGAGREHEGTRGEDSPGTADQPGGGPD